MRELRLALLLTCVAWLGDCLERDLKALNPCLVSSVSRKVSVNNIDKVDLLFSWLEVSDGRGHVSRDSVLDRGYRGRSVMPLTAAETGWLRASGGPC